MLINLTLESVTMTSHLPSEISLLALSTGERAIVKKLQPPALQVKSTHSTTPWLDKLTSRQNLFSKIRYIIKRSHANAHMPAYSPAKETAHHHSLIKRLMDTGFIPGESVQILHKSFWKKGPIAVRVGQSTFALRPFEAALIVVTPFSLQISYDEQ